MRIRSLKLNKLKSKIVFLPIFACLSLWPVSLLRVSPNNLSIYFLPSIFVLIGYILYCHAKNIWPIFILILPFIDIKLLPLPVLFFSIYFLINHKKNLKLIYLFLAALLLIIRLPDFQKQSIFIYDYEANQSLLRKIYLYPNVYFARFSQNKLNLYSDKATNNIFALTDPNNYFFSFHPREITLTNHNLDKYPFPSIIFFVFGFYYLFKHPQFKFILSLILALILSLSLLHNFDLNDFILYIPLSTVFVYGAKIIKQKHLLILNLSVGLCLTVTIFELLKSFLVK
jgi:hypothetical protein